MIRLFSALVLSLSALLAHAAVDVNKAGQAELETVKGIGPAMSAKILAARKSGEFRNWADMSERVPGIGTRNAARLSQAGLTVSGEPYTATASNMTKPYKSTRNDKAAVDPASKGKKAPVKTVAAG